MASKNIPDDINKYLSYDEYTGDLTWIKKTGCKTVIGNIAGTVAIQGYITIGFKGKIYRAHRIIWFLKTGKQPTNTIDHINGNKADNTWSNLREATSRQNNYNTCKKSTNTSGFKGVGWHSPTNEWLAQIRVDGKKKHLGLFNTPEKAHLAYCSAANKYHEEFKNYG